MISFLKKFHNFFKFSFQVENLELTSSQIDNFDDKEELKDQKPNLVQEPSQIELSLIRERRAEEINQQLVDLELKLPHFEAESDESELDL